MANARLARAGRRELDVLEPHDFRGASLMDENRAHLSPPQEKRRMIVPASGRRKALAAKKALRNRLATRRGGRSRAAENRALRPCQPRWTTL